VAGVIVAQSPLRISFFGGGTDIPGAFALAPGRVLSAAIDKFVYVVAKPRFDDLIRVAYTRTEIVATVDEVRHDLVREALRTTGVDRGIEIATFADIPSEGTGLGSSSAITVGLLHALHAFRGEAAGAAQLAAEACAIEVERLGRPIGFQDQYASAFGGLRGMRFPAGGPVECRRVDLPADVLRRVGEQLLLFFTGSTRPAETVLDDQARRVGENRAALVAMAEQAALGEEMLRAGALEEFGRLLHEGWLLKRGLSPRVSTDGIERMYAAAREAGALGGKVTGAGGGGFLLLFCPAERQAAVRAALAGFPELPFRLWGAGSRILYQL
jgi:D-glycero-alpha-D-manno-heptose-7-phosphate kinase